MKTPCHLCGAKVAEAFTRCPSCFAWAVFPITQAYSAANANATTSPTLEADGTLLLSDATSTEYKRIKTGDWDEPLGGGLVVSSVVLIGGPPGAGKSTASLKLASLIIEATGREVLIVAAEEGTNDIKPRAIRLGLEPWINRMRIIPLGSEADLESVIHDRKPAGVIVDSLQGFTQDLDMQCQIAKSMKPLAVTYECPIVLLSQVTKDEDFAGLNRLQHDVDTLLLFTVHEDMGQVRELSAKKNRFGKTLGSEKFFFMSERGLEPIANPYQMDDDELEALYERFGVDGGTEE